MTQDIISYIPNEILFMILRYVNQGILSLVCRKWYYCIKSIQPLHTIPGSLSLNQFEYFRNTFNYNADLMASICKSGNLALIGRLLYLNCPCDTRAMTNLARFGNKDFIIYGFMYHLPYNVRLIENAILGANNHNLSFIQFLVDRNYPFDHKSIIAALRVNDIEIYQYLCVKNIALLDNIKAFIKYSCKTKFHYPLNINNHNISLFEHIAHSHVFYDQYNVYKYMFKFNFVEILENEHVARMIKYYMHTQSTHEDYYISDEIILWCKNNTKIDYINLLLKGGNISRINHFINKYKCKTTIESLKVKILDNDMIEDILDNNDTVAIGNFLLTYQTSLDKFICYAAKENLTLLEFMIDNRLFGCKIDIGEILALNNINLIIKLISKGYKIKYKDLIMAVGYYDLTNFKTLYSYCKTTSFLRLMKTCVMLNRLDIIEFLLDESDNTLLANEMMETSIRYNKLEYITWGLKRGIKMESKYLDLALSYKRKEILLFFSKNRLISGNCMISTDKKRWKIM